MNSNQRSSKGSAILAITATAAVLFIASHWSVADEDSGPAVPCAGVCSIYAPDAETVIRTVDVTGSDLYSLKQACAKEAGYFDHAWSVAPNPDCPNE